MNMYVTVTHKHMTLTIELWLTSQFFG